MGGILPLASSLGKILAERLVIMAVRIPAMIVR